MVTLAQRVKELRTRQNISRPELASRLSLPKNIVEKWETGRQSPTKEQLQCLADFFGVSLYYLRGESNDPTCQDPWMNSDFHDDELPAKTIKTKSRPIEPPPSAGQGTIFDSFLKSKSFQDMLRETVREVLRSSDGHALIRKAVRQELGQEK